MMRITILAACVMLFFPYYQARLCDRMTSCDLFRFIRTHNKQISTVDEKTVRVDFLTISLYNEGMDLQRKMELLEANLTQISVKRNTLTEQAVDENEFEHVDHRGANQNLHQVILVLRKWLTDLRNTLNSTYNEAVLQNDEIQRLKTVVRDEHQKVNWLNTLLENQEETPSLDEKNTTLTDYSNSSHSYCGDKEDHVLCNNEANKKYEMLSDDKRIHFASAELETMKTSLANLVILVNETEQICNNRLDLLATKISLLKFKLNESEANVTESDSTSHSV